MGKDASLMDAFKRMVTPDSNNTFIAKVLEVNKENKTIRIEDTDGLDYDEVRLSSVIDSSNKIIQFPKVASSVLVSCIDNDENTLFVSAYSEVESMEGVIDQLKFHFDSDGFLIENKEENLKEVLNDFQKEFSKLCDELNKVVVSVGVSPNVAAITLIKEKVSGEIKQRLNKILK